MSGHLELRFPGLSVEAVRYIEDAAAREGREREYIDLLQGRLSDAERRIGRARLFFKAEIACLRVTCFTFTLMFGVVCLVCGAAVSQHLLPIPGAPFASTVGLTPGCLPLLSNGSSSRPIAPVQGPLQPRSSLPPGETAAPGEACDAR